MFGWRSRAEIRASAWNRARDGPSSVSNTFSATSRSNPGRRATYTTPIPPRASSRASWYGPMVRVCAPVGRTIPELLEGGPCGGKVGRESSGCVEFIAPIGTDHETWRVGLR